MTITLTKTRMAIVVLVIAMIAPATAVATHIFDDVPDGAFYADSVEWASANGITLGRTADLFDPDAGVTRGESVTFLRRYDDNIVQPALAALPTVHTARVNFDGTLIRGSSGVTSSKGAVTGSYTIDFPADISACTWQATPTSGVGLIIIDTAEVFVTLAQAGSPIIGAPIDADTINATIFTEDGTTQDHQFDLVVHC